MKKLKNIKSLLSREEMRQIQGGSGGSGYCTVMCSSGSQYHVPNCDGAPDGACHSSGWTICTCIG
jgi:hypothetical protein